MLDSLGPPLRRKCLHILCKICGRQALLPRSLQITPRCDRSDHLWDLGGRIVEWDVGGRIFQWFLGGLAVGWESEDEGTAVVVKALIVMTNNADKVIKVGHRPTPFRQCEWRCLLQLLRYYSGKSSCGKTSAIQTCSHCWEWA